ncbi:MAG: hypothetical protein ACR2JJ_07130 [Sphingomicrobium sp.]
MARGSMRTAGVLALLGAALEAVAILWIIVAGRPILNPVAPFFLLIPIGACLAGLYMLKATVADDRSCLFLALLLPLLGANLIAFFFFVAMHSGGM